MRSILNGINLILMGLLLGKTIAIPETLNRRADACTPWKEEFDKGMGMFVGEGQVSVENGKLIMKISPGNTPNPTTGILMGYGAKVTSNVKVLYGTLTARIKAARVGGIVSAFVLMSPEKDEVDWEWVGKNEFSSQTNYYSKGELDYTKGLYINNSFNVHADFHDYTIKWGPDELVWLIDGNPVRTLRRADTGGKYPNTPSNIYFSLWDGGSNAPGTRDWAGGVVNWKDSEIVRQGYMSAEVESITYTC